MKSLCGIYLNMITKPERWNSDWRQPRANVAVSRELMGGQHTVFCLETTCRGAKGNEESALELILPLARRGVLILRC